jgi:serine/threonine protein kinase
MALAAGTKLGPYEIQSPLGAGGMDEAYRARDTRLDRTVAVKILPSHLSENDKAKQRFDRETRAISSLNHPNICTLYDVDGFVVAPRNWRSQSADDTRPTLERLERMVTRCKIHCLWCGKCRQTENCP